MNAQQRIQRQLEEVLKQPGNDNCADCHAKAPRWASTNLGIFLCVVCASVHRKMGTHMSRVKSVTLDEWTREQVVGMRDIGNLKSNAIWNPDERKNPPPAATSTDERDSDISKYVRRKYELGAFRAGAAKGLAQSNAITSRGQVVASRGGLAPQSTGSSPTDSQRRPSFADTNRDLPALPPSAGRRPSRDPSQPLWSGLSANPTSTGPGTSPSARSSSLPRPAPSPVPHNAPLAGDKKPDLLVDVEGSALSTRPLQVNTASIPTIPWQPPTAPNGFQPLPSPMGQAVSPLALGQQAFSPPGHNPYFQTQSFSTSPMNGGGGMMIPQQTQNGMLAPQMLSPGMTGMNGVAMGGMHMNGMNGMSTSPMGMDMTGMSLPNGMMQNPMASSPMGMGMHAGQIGGQNGHHLQMNGGMGMSAPMGGMNMGGMGMQQGMPMYQQQQWGSYNV